MTEQEINIAVAKACGWKWYRRPSTGPWAKKPMRSLYHPDLMKPLELALADMTERECNYVFMVREGMIPNYAHDLNACFEFEETMTDGEVQKYFDQLVWVTSKVSNAHRFGVNYWSIYHATAPQRCQAFLRVKGLWREE